MGNGAALVLLHRRYVRTCRICGDHWEVTRRQAAGSPGRMRRPRRVPRGGGQGQGGFDVSSSVKAFDAAIEVWQAYRRCPHCGIDDFRQEPRRPDHPSA
jgi:hypothetical protein